MQKREDITPDQLNQFAPMTSDFTSRRPASVKHITVNINGESVHVRRYLGEVGL